ncbi:MAG: histidinol dehydrogenase [Candidatus Obscuribacterales bacterium]|jgi:histidinol dehydrogenase
MTDSKTAEIIPLLTGEQARHWAAAQTCLQDESPCGTSGTAGSLEPASEAAELADELRLENSVREIIALVRTSGDKGLATLAKRFKDSAPNTVKLDAASGEALSQRLPQETKDILDEASKRIRRFAEAVVAVAKPVAIDCGEYTAGFDFKPVGRVACYIPAGRYPLPSTALMTAVTAQVAGVKDICIVSPCLKDEILYAGSLAGVTEFHEIGGAQAVAAVAYGTEAIKPVDMIVGPGNAYVTEAKRQVYGKVGIDMLAGPSEVAIVADSGANAEWLALDLLSQAEHDPNARSYLLTDNLDLAKSVATILVEKVTELNLPDYINIALSSSAIVVLDSIESCIAAANGVAPEHLQLQVKDPAAIKSQLKNYGALFMGYNATVPYGDYAAGPNHTLPTNRAARFAGGLNPFTFLRGQSWLHLPGRASELSKLTAGFADLEGLTAHAAAARARLV